jgi:hypothetical protein
VCEQCENEKIMTADGIYARNCSRRAFGTHTLRTDGITMQTHCSCTFGHTTTTTTTHEQNVQRVCVHSDYQIVLLASEIIMTERLTHQPRVANRIMKKLKLVAKRERPTSAKQLLVSLVSFVGISIPYRTSTSKTVQSIIFIPV